MNVALTLSLMCLDVHVHTYMYQSSAGVNIINTITLHVHVPCTKSFISPTIDLYLGFRETLAGIQNTKSCICLAYCKLNMKWAPNHKNMAIFRSLHPSVHPAPLE